MSRTVREALLWLVTVLVAMAAGGSVAGVAAGLLLVTGGLR